MAETSDLKTRVLLKAAFADTTLFGAIDREDASGTGFVAFRGTKNYKDWIDDFLFAPVSFDEVEGKPFVHAGFHKVYQLVRKSLLDQIHLLSGVKRVVVTGHSLGAAVSTLCTLDLASQGVLPKVESCTFASPRTFSCREFFQGEGPEELASC